MLVGGQQDLDGSIKLSLTAQDYALKIDSEIKNPFMLIDSTYEADVYMDSDEFYYLTDLSQDTVIAPDDLKRAVSYLFKKNKFERIDVCLTDCPGGKIVHFCLVGYWTLERVTFYGVVVGSNTPVNGQS